MMVISQNPVILLDKRVIFENIRIFSAKVFRSSFAVSMKSKSEKTSASAMRIADLRDIRLTLEGDADAYRRIVEHHQEQISKILWKFTRDRNTHEELVQEVFVEAYTSLATYKAKAPLSHWLAKISTHVGYHYWRQNAKLKKKEEFSFEDWDRLADEDELDKTDADEAAELLHKMLGLLSERNRLVLTLRYLEDCGIDETAKRTGWTKTMVKVQTWRARNELKKLFEDSGRELTL